MWHVYLDRGRCLSNQISNLNGADMKYYVDCPVLVWQIVEEAEFWTTELAVTLFFGFGTGTLCSCLASCPGFKLKNKLLMWNDFTTLEWYWKHKETNVIFFVTLFLSPVIFKGKHDLSASTDKLTSRVRQIG